MSTLDQLQYEEKVDLISSGKPNYESLSLRRGRQFSYGEMEEATNNFDERMILGNGGEGTVYKGVIFDHTTNTNITVAVKIVNPRGSFPFCDALFDICADLFHPNIISVVGYCNESPRKIVVYKYMAQGSLQDNLKAPDPGLIMSWGRRLDIALDVARALSHLHSGTTRYPNGIIHRDVKPANILLDENFNAALADFGLHKVCPPPRTESSALHISTQLKGTPGYVAPEYIRNHQITNKVDVYAYGMVLFQLLCRKSPWECSDASYYPKADDNLGDLALLNIDPLIIHQISEDCLKAYTDLISKTLRQDPAARPTMAQVVIELEIALEMQRRYDSHRSSSELPTDLPQRDLPRGCQFEEAKLSATVLSNPHIILT